MNLHEYQAKDLLNTYGVPVPAGAVADTPESALAAARALGGSRWVVKVQVHAGGRGKAGGVRVVESLEGVRDVTGALLGRSLVTAQTGPQGQPVGQVLVEVAHDIAREYYLGLLTDRERAGVVIIASGAGGTEVERQAVAAPASVLQEHVDPCAGFQDYQGRNLAFGLGLRGGQVNAFTGLLKRLYRAFTENDLSLLEINPLALVEGKNLLAVDCKAVVDDNALFRQKALADRYDASQEDARETAARAAGLNYVALTGDIGCMVNGAGLAMATMDLIKLHGGEPANFLDVGGGASAETVARAFRILTADAGVRAILVNIFGGIMRCDVIAEGIIRAVQDTGLSLPVVVRLEGTNAEQGRALLAASGLRITAAESLARAAELAVGAAQ